MTFEHKLIVSLEEIKAIVFRCNECKASTCFVPDAFVSLPQNCPNGHVWRVESPTGQLRSVVGTFIVSVVELRKPIYEKLGFKIFLEFDQPKP